MALPLPRVVADVGPGGGLVTAMGGMNSLANDMLLRKINQVKAQYAPLTTQAEAASKLAYANLMGPQFLAKIMGNDSALANMSEDQKKAALQKIYQAGSGQGGGLNAFNQIQQAQGHPTGIGQPGTNALSGWFANTLKNAFGNKPTQNAGTGYDNSDNPGVSAEGPGPIDSGSPFVGRKGYKPPPTNQKRPKGGVMLEGEQWYDKNGNPVYDEEVDVSGEPTMNLELTKGQKPKTYAENTGQFKGVIEEGKELGKIRAQAISDLDEQYQQAVQAEVPIDHLVEMTQDPVFQNMRSKVPFFQDKQLDALSKIGTPEEQRAVGDFTTTATNAVANTVNSFRGRILDKEVTMANQMKINPKDTWNTMLGKLASVKTFNEMTKQRSRIASKLIADQHMNRGEAIEIADKQVDGKAIRKEVEGKLSPKPTEDDINYMAQKYNTSPDEIRKRLQAKGLL